MRPRITLSVTRPRAARWRVTAFACACLPWLGLALGGAGCSYIFSETRTSYDYEPSSGGASPDFRRSLDVLGTELAPHNRAMLLLNGDETFGAMLAAIRSAQSSVNLELYIFDHGQVASEFSRALAERARAGVEVRLLVDGFGSNLGNL